MFTFVEGGKLEREPGEKPSEQGQEPTTNSAHITPGPGIEPGPHWWEARALTTVPTLLPQGQVMVIIEQKRGIGRSWQLKIMVPTVWWDSLTSHSTIHRLRLMFLKTVAPRHAKKN